MSRWEVVISIAFGMMITGGLILALADACAAPVAYSSFRGGA